MNFHGQIALPLETRARETGITTSADSIECGQFVEIMFRILEAEGVSYEKFKKKCLSYKGKTALEISEQKAVELYDEFKFLIYQN